MHVEGRDEVGVVLEEGTNIGITNNVYCISVYFPSTGEVAYYEKGRERTVDL